MQAFHWFDQDRAHAEFVRILKPRGWVALLWNTRLGRTSLMKEYDKLLQSFSTDYREVDHRNVTGDLLNRFHPGFQKRTFPNAHELSYEALRGRLLSSSYAPLLGTPNFEPMLEELSRVFTRHQKGGMVRFEYETELYFAQFK